jgi:hypothetical protein
MKHSGFWKCFFMIMRENKRAASRRARLQTMQSKPEPPVNRSCEPKKVDIKKATR